jgi:hypothetical protein
LCPEALWGFSTPGQVAHPLSLAPPGENGNYGPFKVGPPATMAIMAPILPVFADIVVGHLTRIAITAPPQCCPPGEKCKHDPGHSPGGGQGSIIFFLTLAWGCNFTLQPLQGHT